MSRAKLECRGHESTDGPIGNVTYCDGSCRQLPNYAQHPGPLQGQRRRRPRKPKAEKKPIAWNEPPPGALEWLRACIESSRASAVKWKLRELARKVERGWTQEEIQRDERDFGPHSRAAALCSTLLLRSDNEKEFELLMLWLEQGFTPPELPPSEWLAVAVKFGDSVPF